MFGVLDESNWTVCQQEPAPGTVDASGVRLVVDRTCPAEGDGRAEGDDGAEPSAGSEESTPAETTVAAEAEPKRTDKFRVPRLVGRNLQLAQDILQARGSYLLDQQDASGLGRLQLLDSNWVVCKQRPAPGVRVPVDRMVRLSAVKYGESC
jgi:hypothetical protein